ncbi:MAG: TonB-dependent receptor [Candidatus Omnitrophica bacterium]|nr:TonB-dependent receptor [Candidatus Omnitrophota bacterium]
MKRLFIIIGLIICCVNISIAEEEKAVELEPIVITPWRAGEELSDVSRNVTVITKEEIASSSANFLPDLIQDKSGVVVSNYFGNPKGVVVDVRGFGESSVSNVLVLVDGRRTNQVDLSGADWAQIDINAIERVEIVRGPSTVLYGDNATGGVINIITKRGTTDKPSITLAAESGSYQYYKAYANLSGVYKSSTVGKDSVPGVYADYFFSYSNQDTTGYRANNDYWANDYFGSLMLRLSDVFELALSSGYHRDHYGMPGALYWNGNQWVLDPKGINQIGRAGTVFSDDKGFTSDYFVTAEPKGIFFFAGNEINLSVFSSMRERRSKGLSVPEPDAWSAPSEYETSHHIITYELRPKIETSLLWKGIDNKLIIGTDYFHAKDDVLSGNRLNAQQDETDIYKETLGFYVHDNIKISDRLLLNAGGRLEWADYTFNQKRLIPNHETRDLTVEAFNFGGGYKYNKRSQVYADVSKSYRLPNTEEYYQNKFLNTWLWPPVVQGGLNTNITRQKAMNYEVGIKDLTFKGIGINANAFLMDIENEIYYDPSSMLNTNYDKKTCHRGIEIEAQLKFLDGRLRPFGNWVLQESYFKDGDYKDNQIPLVPRNKISAGVTISPIKNLDWTVSLNHVGSRYKISDQKNLAAKLKDYTIVDTKLSYTYKYLNIWGALKNVFDKEYFAYGVTNSTGTAETFYPAPEMRVEWGASMTF